jgi:hypothetical protein
LFGLLLLAANGKLHAREALDRMLAEIEQMARSP